MFREANNSRLGEMGRQTTSIRPPPENYQSYSQPQSKDDELFRSYEDIMRNVDKQLNQSRKMFPDD